MKSVVYYAFFRGLYALLAEWEDYKNRYEVLVIKNRCISGLAAKAKE